MSVSAQPTADSVTQGKAVKGLPAAGEFRVSLAPPKKGAGITKNRDAGHPPMQFQGVTGVPATVERIFENAKIHNPRTR